MPRDGPPTCCKSTEKIDMLIRMAYEDDGLCALAAVGLSTADRDLKASHSSLMLLVNFQTLLLGKRRISNERRRVFLRPTCKVTGMRCEPDPRGMCPGLFLVEEREEMRCVRRKHADTLKFNKQGSALLHRREGPGHASAKTLINSHRASRVAPSLLQHHCELQSGLSLAQPAQFV